MKTKIKRLIPLLLLIVALVGIPLSIVALKSPGTDYTKEYSAFKDVREMSEVQQVTEYLQSKKLEYTIAGGRLTVKEFGNIIFSVTGNSTCKIDNNVIMQNFQKLDNNDINVVIEGKHDKKGNVVEQTSICEKSLTATKVNDRYYYNTQKTLFTVILSLCTVIVLVFFIGFFIKTKFNKRKKNTEMYSE